MTFQECLGCSPFEIIWQRMNVLYPDEKGIREGYEKVYNDILAIKPIKNNMRIRIDYIDDKDDLFNSHPYWDVHGVDDKRLCDIPVNEGGVSEDHEKSEQLITYAIEYEPRAKWAGMVIDVSTACNMPTVDISVHGLWEMTFAGFDEPDVKLQLNEIKERVDEVQKVNKDDLVEVREGVFCHKDSVEKMEKLFKGLDDVE